jgi:CRISPR-associated protein Csh1
MLRELAEIGRISRESYVTHIFSKRELELSKNKDIKKKLQLKIIVINFNKDGKYIGCEIEDYDENKKDKYYYAWKSSKGPNYSPTCKFSGDLNKVFRNKIKGWFDSYSGKDDLINQVKSIILKEESKIKKDLENKMPGGKTRIGITIKIDGRYIGEIDSFKKECDDIYNKRKYEQPSKKEAKTGTSVCMVCLKKTKVSPVSISDALPFSTIEKTGFLTNFDMQNAWKNIPVCVECGKNITSGKNFLDANLNFNLYGGIKFYIIPKFVLRNIDKNILDEIIKSIKATTSEEGLRGLITNEDYFSKNVINLGDILSFVYFFYEKQQAKMRILDISEEVTPSWIKKIFDARDEAVNYFIFKEDFLKKIFTENYEGSIRFNSLAEEFRKFFPLKSRELGVYENYFIDIINSILSNKKIRKDFLISQFMKVIRNDFKDYEDRKRWYNWIDKTINAIKIIKFLNKLNLIYIGPNSDEMANLIDTEEKKASFLVGVYVAKLLDEQYRMRGSKPFSKKLFGLNFDENKIKGLFKEALDKFVQYDKEYFYEWLSEKIAYSFLNAGTGWKSNNDEISFCFTCGLALGKALNKEEVEKILKDGVY